MGDRLPYPPPYQDIATLAQHICTGETTIESWVKMGLFPAPSKKIGGKRLWRWKDVERHLIGNDPSAQSSSSDLMARIRDGTRKAAQIPAGNQRLVKLCGKRDAST
jgi:hypothetical protein